MIQLSGKSTPDQGEIWLQVFRSVTAALGLRSREQIEAWLTGLRVTSGQLRDKYQRPKPVVDYSDPDVQFSYLLRYFVPYTQLVPYSLKLIEVDFPAIRRAEIGNVVLLGGGPAPELIGYLQWLQADARRANSAIECTVVDRLEDSWAWWHHQLEAELSSKRAQVSIARSSGANFDASPQNPLPADVLNASARPLVVAQNLFNELSPNKDRRCLLGLKNQITRTSGGGYVLLVHSTEYDAVEKLYSWAVDLFEEAGATVTRQPVEMNLNYNGIPPLLHQTFHRYDRCWPIKYFNTHGFEYLFAEFPGVDGKS